jgi:hypothetical protein
MFGFAFYSGINMGASLVCKNSGGVLLGNVMTDNACINMRCMENVTVYKCSENMYQIRPKLNLDFRLPINDNGDIVGDS